MFAKYENETVYLEAFADYWNPARAAKIPFAEYKYVPESSTRMASLHAGEAHVIERVDIEKVPVLEDDSNFVVTEKLSEEQRYIVFKTTQDVMGNELVREAIAHAVDRETIANDILQGYGVLADSYLPKVSNLYAPIDNMIQYNPERAAELLAEAGYPGGEGLPKIKYITSTGLYPKTKEYAEYIVSTLTEVGFDIELVVEETAIWEQHLYEEDSCLMCDTGWMNVGGATNFILGTHYRGPGRCNFSSYPEVDAALDAESTCTDPAQRKAIIQNELYPLLVETNTNMPLFDSVLVYACAANMQGLEIMPTSNINFAALSLG
jgi:peptide/nickel transport system substrate-binding protein